MKSISLTSEEIIILLNKYNNLINNNQDSYQLRKYNLRVLDLRRMLSESNSSKELKFTIDSCSGSTKVKIYCNHILGCLGYSNDIYKLESEVLSDKLYKVLKWNIGGRGYTNELLATCIVREIFNYYIHEWTEIQLLSIYNPNYKLFLNTAIRCNRWCINHYWKSKVKHK